MLKANTNKSEETRIRQVNTLYHSRSITLVSIDYKKYVVASSIMLMDINTLVMQFYLADVISCGLQCLANKD